MKTKTLAVAAIAALAIPVAAQAKPDNPGQQGRDKAASKQQAKQTKTRSVGFTVKGVSAVLSEGAVTLDPTAANRHARLALDLGKPKALRTSTDTVEITDAVNGFVVRWNGFEGQEQTVAPTDRVKVIGKVVRTRDARQKGKRQTFSYGDVDIRRVVVTRPSGDSNGDSNGS